MEKIRHKKEVEETIGFVTSVKRVKSHLLVQKRVGKIFGWSMLLESKPKNKLESFW